MKLEFGSSGIRGEYPDEVTRDVASELAKRLTLNRGASIVLGFDPRLSGPALKAAFLSGALESGALIKDYGLVPTPTISFETRSQRADFGVMITASHNPPAYNGFKVFNPQGEAFDEETSLAMGNDSTQPPPRTSQYGTVDMASPWEYEARLSGIVLGSRWKVVLDPGNGAASWLAPRIYGRVLDKVTVINSVPDGAFSARGSEPTRQSMRMLGKVVVETGADAGIGFDGDGDRMFLVDEKGVCPLQDRVLGFYIAALSKQSKGPFLVPLDASMAIDEVAEQCGAHLIRGPVGDAKLLREMRRLRGTFAGEPSGAWIHPSFNPCPDGLLSGLLVLKAVEESNMPVSGLVKNVPEYYMLRQSVAIRTAIPQTLLKSLRMALKKVVGDGASITTEFGLRVSSPRSWVLVRRSGTEPVMRVTCESKERPESNRIMRATLQLVRRYLKSRTRL